MKRRSLLTAGVAALFLAPRTRAAVHGVEYVLDREAGAISVLRGGVPVQTLPSASPVAIAAHPNGRFLYVVNGIGEYRHLPRGTVETYAIHGAGIERVAVTPLSLSATFPSDIAISPDGRHAVVAVAGGRSYNVLPVAPRSGKLQAPAQIVKRYGLEPDRVAFDPTGTRVYGGNAEVFRFENGALTLL